MNKWEKFIALAERLGVEPLPRDADVCLSLRIDDGHRYDLLEVLNAVLDRLDKAAP